MNIYIINGSMQFCKPDDVCQNVSVDGWVNSLISSWINEKSFLLGISINHFKTDLVFFHWLKWSSEISFLLILSMISLPTLISSFFAGLIKRHDGFCRKSSLWSLSVTKAGVLAIHSMRASRKIGLAILFASKFIDVSWFDWCFFVCFGDFIMKKFLCYCSGIL